MSDRSAVRTRGSGLNSDIAEYWHAREIEQSEVQYHDSGRFKCLRLHAPIKQHERPARPHKCLRLSLSTGEPSANLDTFAGEVTTKTTSTGPGSFDTDFHHLPMAGHPGEQVAITGWSRRKGIRSEYSSGFIDYGCDRVLLVGVDASYYVEAAVFRHAGGAFS